MGHYFIGSYIRTGLGNPGDVKCRDCGLATTMAAIGMGAFSGIICPGPANISPVDEIWRIPYASPVSSKPTCLDCEIELSSTLDAYYGLDESLKSLCVKCRRHYE